MPASIVTIKDANGTDRVIATELNAGVHTFRHVIVTDDGSLVYDSTTESIKYVDFAHHKTHEKKAYILSTVDIAMANNDYIGFSFTTPVAAAGRPHFVMKYESKAAAHIELIEIPQTLTNGSVAVPLNRHRDGGGASTLTDVLSYNSIAGDVILQGTGTVIQDFYTWASKQIGGGARSDREMVLKPSTSYAVLLTADANTNAGHIELTWYEHVDS